MKMKMASFVIIIWIWSMTATIGMYLFWVVKIKAKFGILVDIKSRIFLSSILGPLECWYFSTILNWIIFYSCRSYYNFLPTLNISSTQKSCIWQRDFPLLLQYSGHCPSLYQQMPQSAIMQIFGIRHYLL